MRNMRALSGAGGGGVDIAPRIRNMWVERTHIPRSYGSLHKRAEVVEGAHRERDEATITARHYEPFCSADRCVFNYSNHTSHRSSGLPATSLMAAGQGGGMPFNVIKETASEWF